MEGSQFRTRAQLERQMDAARQLRAETLARAIGLFITTLLVAGTLRRAMQRLASDALRRA